MNEIVPSVQECSGLEQMTRDVDRFRVLAELSLTGVYLTQGDRFEYVNPALARMFSYSVDELVGRLGPIDLVYPPDREIAAESLRRRLDGEAEAVRYELRGTRKDGSVFPIEVHSRRLEQGGKVGLMGTLLDITERRRAEESLQDSQSKSEEMQRIARVGWWEWDFRTNRVSLSDEICRTFGVNAVDLPEWHERWLKLIHPDDRAMAAQAAAAALRGGPRYDIEYRVVRPDGDLRIVRSQGDVTWDESGRPLRQFGVLQDITELRHAERALRASEERFRTFVDHAADAFFLHDEDLIIIDVNRAACISLGYGREELIGLRPHDFDVGLDEAAIQKLRQRIALGETLTFETRHQRKDGSIFPVEVRAVQFEQGARGRRHLCLARDISERRQAEEALRESEDRFRALVRFAFDSYWETDEEHRFVRQEFGEFSADLPQPRSGVGKKPWEVGYLDTDAEAWRRHREMIESHRPFRDFELVRLMPDGDKGYLSVSGMPIRDRTGRFLGYRGVARFTTEQKRAEEALREMQAQLAHANRVATMGQLSASIAHEVNQPIAAALANAEAALSWLTRKQQNLSEARKALKRIVQNVSRASDVVERVRRLGRGTSRREDSIQINDMIREVIDLTSRDAAKHHVLVKTQFQKGLPPAQGDRVELQQVILNLILNAVEAMSGSEEPREIVIATVRRAADEALVAVRDTGPGLTSEVQENLFTAFYTTKPNGLGLGLSICRSIVERHGGRLWASANAPRGAVFQFTIPIPPVA